LLLSVYNLLFSQYVKELNQKLKANEDADKTDLNRMLPGKLPELSM